jgi:hypothetical protein
VTRGLSISHQAATYLTNFTLKHPISTATTHRKRFICHVREYNLLSSTRRRFYILGLSDEEIEFLKNLPALPAKNPSTTIDSIGGYGGKEKVEEGGKAMGLNGGEIKPLVTGFNPAVQLSKFLSNDSKDIATKSTTHQLVKNKNINWATDGCPLTLVSNNEIKNQEVEVDNLINHCLKKYAEKKTFNIEDYCDKV